MRTNIDINDELMAQAMRAAGTHTKRETVEAGLKTLVRLEAQNGLRDLWGMGWEGDLEAMRLDK